MVTGSQEERWGGVSDLGVEAKMGRCWERVEKQPHETNVDRRQDRPTDPHVIPFTTSVLFTQVSFNGFAWLT